MLGIMAITFKPPCYSHEDNNIKNRVINHPDRLVR
jgi:hypothetical protein